MKARLALLCLLLCPAAFAETAAIPLHDLVNRSAVVIDATITSARTASYRHRGQSGVCGFIYEATVKESLLGSLSGTIAFASNQSLAPEHRLLLFLRDDSADFQREASALNPPDGMRKAHAACVAALPRLKSDQLQSGDFDHPITQPVTWFIRLGRGIAPPAELQANFIEVRQAKLDGVLMDEGSWPRNAAMLPDQFARYTIVDWNRLRQWLLQNAPTVFRSATPALRR